MRRTLAFGLIAAAFAAVAPGTAAAAPTTIVCEADVATQQGQGIGIMPEQGFWQGVPSGYFWAQIPCTRAVVDTGVFDVLGYGTAAAVDDDPSRPSGWLTLNGRYSCPVSCAVSSDWVGSGSLTLNLDSTTKDVSIYDAEIHMKPGGAISPNDFFPEAAATVDILSATDSWRRSGEGHGSWAVSALTYHPMRVSGTLVLTLGT